MWTTWRDATERALYGPDGFYRRTEPRAHFRTSVHASPLFARAVLTLARETGVTTIVDLGAGRGELLLALHSLDPSLALVGVEVADPPAHLPADVDWRAELPGGLEALVVANEWLDNVPVDVVELTEDGPRLVEVDPATGSERLGDPAAGSDLEWLDRWWTLREVGHRAEIGRARDEAWAAVVGRLVGGLAVAADYAHDRGSRPPGGSLAGYRGGRQVVPVPDGSCDITSQVALDSCAAAGARAGATATLLTTQRDALRALGVGVGVGVGVGPAPAPGHAPAPARAPAPAIPPRALQTRLEPPAAAGVSAALAALRDAGEAAELTDRGGLGGFSWLVQTVGTALPAVLASPEPAAGLTP